jgi:bilirubin oxidase
VLASKYYNENGTLESVLREEQSSWGDIIHANGQPWPFLRVQPRKYRLRFLNAALSRNFKLSFSPLGSPQAKAAFQVIASDAGLLEVPVTSRDLIVAVAERYEVVIDFAPFAGQSVELRNDVELGDLATDDEYLHTDKVMRFDVSADPVNDPSTVPDVLRAVPFPPRTRGVDHHFRFERTNSEWRINGVGFEDAANRVLARPPRGTVEIWELENSSGGWTHPIHVHLVDFRVISRDSGRGVEPYEAAGLKDVVWLARGETVQVEAHYAPWNGTLECPLSVLITCVFFLTFSSSVLIWCPC